MTTSGVRALWFMLTVGFRSVRLLYLVFDPLALSHIRISFLLIAKLPIGPCLLRDSSNSRANKSDHTTPKSWIKTFICRVATPKPKDRKCIHFTLRRKRSTERKRDNNHPSRYLTENQPEERNRISSRRDKIDKVSPSTFPSGVTLSLD